MNSRIIFMGLNRTILPFVSLLDLVAIAVLNLGMPLQVAKQDISKPTQRMLTLHTVASTMANWVLSTKKQVKERYLSVSRIEYWAPSSAKNTVFNGRTQLFSQPKKNVCYFSGCTRDRRSRSFIWKSWFIQMIQNYRRNGTNNWIKQEQKYTLRYSPSQNHR
jgi:hypothetical protein